LPDFLPTKGRVRVQWNRIRQREGVKLNKRVIEKKQKKKVSSSTRKKGRSPSLFLRKVESTLA